MTATLRSLTTRAGAVLLLAGGLLASQPAQAQWVAQNSGLPANYGFNFISIVDASTVWASCQDYGSTNPQGANPNSTYIRTANGGTTWTVGTVPIPTAQALVSVSGASSRVAWAACDDLSAGGGRVYYTSDGGTTWTRQLTTGFVAPTGFVNAVLALSTTQAVAAGDPATAGDNFEIYYTTNAGTTWTAATTPAALNTTEGGLTTTVVTIPGTDPAARSCWMGTSAGRVLRSTNSGLTWAVAATGLASISSIAFCSPTNGIAVSNKTTSGVVTTTFAYTTDGGATWTARTPTGAFFPANFAGVPGTTNTFVSGAASSTIGVGSSYSTNGGQTWVAIDTNPHGTTSFLNGTTGYSGGFSTAATGGGGMYKGTLPAAALGTTATRSLPGLSVYPNPATDRFTVAVPAVAEATRVQATLYNALGQAVARQEAALSVGGTQLSFPATGLAAGLYTLRVQAGDALASQQVSVR